MQHLIYSFVVRTISFALIGATSTSVVADDWPQWRGPKRDGVWRESGIIQKFDRPQLDINWRAEIGSGYCGPTVANGSVYVMDRVVKPKQIERMTTIPPASHTKMDVGTVLSPGCSNTIRGLRRSPRTSQSAWPKARALFAQFP